LRDTGIYSTTPFFSNPPGISFDGLSRFALIEHQVVKCGHGLLILLKLPGHCYLPVIEKDILAPPII